MKSAIIFPNLHGLPAGRAASNGEPHDNINGNGPAARLAWAKSMGKAAFVKRLAANRHERVGNAGFAVRAIGF
jgi:hypothetical protein